MSIQNGGTQIPPFGLINHPSTCLWTTMNQKQGRRPYSPRFDMNSLLLDMSASLNISTVTMVFLQNPFSSKAVIRRTKKTPSAVWALIGRMTASNTTLLFSPQSVERYIAFLTTKARTMLLHAMPMWPGLINAKFWPFAISQTSQIHNHSPRRGNNKSPCKLFTNEVPTFHPSNFCAFGFPVFVLVKELQDGKTLQKCLRTRSYMGIYIGQSKNHVSNVALVYNPCTQLVSPQYYLIYNEGFETVASADPINIERNINAMFDNLFDDTEWIHNDDFIDPTSNQSHCYFDFSWDISRIYEDLHAQKWQLTKQLARAIQNNSLLQKQLGIPKVLARKMTCNMQLSKRKRRAPA
jgi:hypothetical protein